MLKRFRPACCITLLFFGFTLHAEETIDPQQFPLYQAPINVQTQHEFDYINSALWTAFRYYQEQQADSYTARLKLSCQQSGMAYRYQDFITANQKFASAEDRASIVLGYLVRAFAVGHSVMDHLADPFVMRMMELDRKVANEADKMRGFLRFREVHSGAESVLLAEIEPKCNLVPLMMDHFSDRFPNENFIMYDCNRKIAAVHEAYHA